MKRGHYNTCTNSGEVQKVSIFYNLVKCKSQEVAPLNVSDWFCNYTCMYKALFISGEKGCNHVNLCG